MRPDFIQRSLPTRVDSPSSCITDSCRDLSLTQMSQTQPQDRMVKDCVLNRKTGVKNVDMLPNTLDFLYVNFIIIISMFYLKSTF